MTRIKTHLLTLVMLSVSLSIFAQMNDAAFELLLKSGTKILPESFTISHDPSEVVNDMYYRYIQFYDLPKAQQKLQLQNAGIELLEYLPHSTFIAALPSDINLMALETLDIRSIAPIALDDKFPSELDRVTKGSNRYLIQFHKNISNEKALCLLEQNQIETTKSSFSNGVIEVYCSISILERLAWHPEILFLESPADRISPESNPAFTQHRSNLLLHSSNGLPFDGTGVNVAIGDDGFVGPHLDFEGRIAANNSPQSISGTHGDMVAGILAGAGNLDPSISGIAKGVELFINNDFEAVEKATDLYNENDVVITSTSYGDGCNRGYTTFTQLADQQIKENPALMHVFSAGNAGDQDCAYGAGAGWGNITGGVKVGKNVLAIGNLDSNDEIVFNSSRGPSNDGRVKPDLCARGENQITTAPDNEFQTSSGSSAAAPVVSGILAQLYQAYRSLHQGENPKSALMKAILLNTANDLGNTGPDYTHGWGKVNANRAYQVLTLENYFSGLIDHGQTLNYNLTIPADVQQAKVMLYWHDQEGTTVSTKSLVNDLDIVIHKNGQSFLPLVLQPSNNPAVLNSPAIYGIDRTNNMEQVIINQPGEGDYSILIDGYQVPFGPQPFFIVYEFIKDQLELTYPNGREKVSSGSSIRIHWDALNQSGNNNEVEILFSSDNGQSWNAIGTTPDNQSYFDWIVPEIISGTAFIKIIRNGLEDQNEVPFHIYQKPTALEVTTVCSDYITLEWEPVQGATQYIIYNLKSKYLDSLTATDQTSIDLPIDNPQTLNWFAVSAIHESGAQSQRSNAINDGAVLQNCILQKDVSLAEITSPATQIIQECLSDNLQVSVNLKNEGTEVLSNFQVYLQYDDLVPIVANYSEVIPAGITVNYNFNSDLNINQPGLHTLKTWTSLQGDQANYNDTSQLMIRVIPSEIVQLPYFENFDNFPTCLASESCENACALQNGWINADNHLEDAIDWKPNRGATQTSGTGPLLDQNANDETGKYLYLEGTPGCFNNEALLYSPCIDLSQSIAPSFSFWYHMRGANMGNLHVDLFDGNTWYNNLIAPISGDQGSIWNNVIIDLSSFAGGMVSLRFRGITGSGFLTDLAIDNISVIETAAPPVTDFITEQQLICTDQSLQLFDNSYNAPQFWNWIVEPATFQFIDGTSAASPNPIIDFQDTGFYSITLITNNEFGSDGMIKENVIQVSDGINLPYWEDFNSAETSSFWDINNPDFNKTWQGISIIGKSAQETQAYYVNNHSYNAIGQEDALTSRVFDLTNAQNPHLRFDVSYAAFNENFNDGLLVELSSDCKASFADVIYFKDGSALATAPAQMTGWTPGSSQDWRTEIIDLSPYIGNKIALKFINICGFGNNLYLDNVTLYELDDFPNPDFILAPDVSEVCIGEVITFQNLSQGLDLENFEWNFGETANPATALTDGPHEVVFNEVGNYDISLKAFNAIGWEEKIHSIQVVDQPIAAFSFSNDGLTISLNNESISGTSYLWNFGDGTLSEAINPQHTYDEAGSYSIRLTTENRCGQNSYEKTFVVTSTSNPDKTFELKVEPNPADDFLHIYLSGLPASEINFTLIDLSGKRVSPSTNLSRMNTAEFSIDVQHLPEGIYFLKATVGDLTSVRKVVVLHQ